MSFASIREAGFHCVISSVYIDYGTRMVMEYLLINFPPTVHTGLHGENTPGPELMDTTSHSEFTAKENLH